MARTQVDRYQVYKFSELSEAVQQKAVERYQQQQAGEFFDSTEFVYDDAATIADLLGLDINTRRSNNGNYSPNIFYSGFWSQGDGACFEGNYQYKARALKAVKAYITQALRNFGDWIYVKLEESYDWDTSEENARDYLENDDREYTANGEEI